jgi:hypothetical protein
MWYSLCVTRTAGKASAGYVNAGGFEAECGEDVQWVRISNSRVAVIRLFGPNLSEMMEYSLNENHNNYRLL